MTKTILIILISAAFIAGTITSGALAFAVPNSPPDCSTTNPSHESLWPPDHQFVSITVDGVTDPDGDKITITVTGITQDEAVHAQRSGHTAPDGKIDGDTANVRSERSDISDGRVYEISFTADDDNGGICDGSVFVGVPHDKNDTAVNSGTTYDSSLLIWNSYG